MFNVMHVIKLTMLLSESSNDLTFGDKNLFLTMEQTGRSGLASFSGSQCHTRDHWSVILSQRGIFFCAVFAQVRCTCPISLITVLYDLYSTVMQLYGKYSL